MAAIPDNPSDRGEHVEVLRITDLSKFYMMGEVRVDALKHISLEFHAGELAVLLGASGSGKSTLLYGVAKNDLPMIGANSVSLVLLMIILYCKIRYR